MAMDFDGTNDYVDIPDDDSLTPGTLLTISAWIFIDAIDESFDSILNKWDQTTAGDELLFGVNTSQNINFAWQTTGSVGTYGTPAFNDTAGTGTFSLSTWTHVAIVRNITQLSFYIDGVLGGSTAAMDSNPFKNGPNSLRIGAQGGRGGVDRYLNGRIDDIRVYNRAFTDDEILSLVHERGRPLDLQGLVQRWKLDEATPGAVASGVGTVKDEGPDQNDGTPTNSPVYISSELTFRRRAG
jgi:hypothetical protein